MKYFKRHNNQGFTLIEVLIAMSLLSIMMGLLFVSMRTVIESWNIGEAKAEKINKKAVFYQFFKQHLINTKPLSEFNSESVNNTMQIPKMVFKGTAQNIRFVSALPSASIRKGEQVFNVGINPQQPSSIIVSLIPYRQSQTQSVDESELLDHVRNIEFSYFGKLNENFERDWQSEWQDTEELPRLVKIKVVLEDESVWPDMVFPLKISAWHTSVNNQQDYKRFDNDKK